MSDNDRSDYSIDMLEAYKQGMLKGAEIALSWFEGAEKQLLRDEPVYGKSYWSGRQDAAQGIAVQIRDEAST